jgi:hypothetical protein
VIADRLLHVVALVAVRARPPLEAKRVVDAFGRLMPKLSPNDAVRLGKAMEGRGSCLTRALAVSARLPGSEVVLGTDGTGDGEFTAHAWVEHGGRLIEGAPAARHVLARLPTR